jgi:hypothetical protein
VIEIFEIFLRTGTMATATDPELYSSRYHHCRYCHDCSPPRTLAVQCRPLLYPAPLFPVHIHRYTSILVLHNPIIKPDTKFQQRSPTKSLPVVILILNPLAI